MKFIFFIFLFFDLKWSKNDQICIQMVKFIFKRLNLNSNGSIKSWQRTTVHRLQWRTVPPGPAPVRTVPPDLGSCYPYHLIPLQRLFGRTVTPSGWALPLASGTSLREWGGAHFFLGPGTSLREWGEAHFFLGPQLPLKKGQSISTVGSRMVIGSSSKKEHKSLKLDDKFLM
jgi:hypothetical protein